MLILFDNLDMMHKRKHIRLRGFSYASPNAYFITICTKDFTQFFGQVLNGIMRLTDIGNTTAVYLQQIPEIREGVILAEWIVMPNHVHCIMEITKSCNNASNSFGKPVQGSISVIINQFKGAVKKWCNATGHSDFEWQPRFYDHVIRDALTYEKIQNYIFTNPSCWAKDKYKV